MRVTTPLGVASSLVVQVASAAGSNPFTDDFSKVVNETLERWKVPGIAIAFVDGNETWAEGYGYATYPTTPATNSTLFFGGSTSKAFTAAALSLLIDSGKYGSLGWTTPISELIRDDFVLEDSWITQHATLEDALSHRTGLGDHTMAASKHYEGRPGTLRDIVRSLRYLPLAAEPRTKFLYCNLMYMTLSYVVETLTSQRLGDVFKDWIWEPLGMTSTYLSVKDAEQSDKDLAHGYYYDEKTKTYKDVPWPDVELVSGAGGIISNVLDYSRWIQSLIGEQPPLSKAGHKAIKTPRMVSGEVDDVFLDVAQSYALGWLTSSYKGRRLWSHNGGIDGFGAEVIFFPDEGFGVVTLGNTASSSNAAGQILLWHLIDEKLGVAPADRFDHNKRQAPPVPSMQWEQSKQLVEGAFDAALDLAYPERPENPLPPTLPSTALVGTYFHPAYQNLTLTLKDGSNSTQGSSVASLVASTEDSLIQTQWEFVHVSGDFWLVLLTSLAQPVKFASRFVRAEFFVGVNGSVEALEIDWLEQGMVKFSKVA
ncbi:putative penicillin-binding protein [Colletotrichum karsti]|uniref:Penicillin-binding protein n=1 Tax=Colletotrichum karsti TaxID=1095194 RepID=A0A9P6LH77_9PEZI|nr:putative penicillin-binding protein [Colletotrichum karsti]KAF9875984.1 putative penicillin-binding protein [Colletotrichum karsti]